MKILIVSIFPETSAIYRYSHYLKKYLSKKNKVVLLDLYEDYKNDVKRAIALINGIKLPDCDVLILVAPLLCNSLLKSNAKLKITIVHDMYPNASLATKILMKTIYPNMKHSDLILPVSNFSKQEIIDKYGLKNKLHMIHGGIDHDIFKDKHMKRDPNLFLHVGRDDPRKNFSFILDLMEKLPNIKLLKIGTISKSDEMRIGMTRLNVEQIENVTDTELVEAYNKVGILLFPSLSEGLGFPPIEAYSCSLPVIAANNSGLCKSCIKESLTKLDLDLWVKKIKKIRTDKKYRDKMIKNGLLHSRKFDWKEYTNQVDTIITERFKY